MPYQSKKGFSILELLVVLLIIAVISAGVALSVGSGSAAKRINQEGEKLFAQMLYALDEALVTDRAIGIDFKQEENDPNYSNDYEWKRHDGFDDDGIPVFTSKSEPGQFIGRGDPLGKRALSENVAWGELEIDGEDDLDKLLLDDDDEENSIPELIFYPSGEITEFSLTITMTEEELSNNPEAANNYYKIYINDRGQLERLRVGEKEE
ncbi:MAG: prepilin-type N-terminal cleavage/methylation domain-containing protein [Cellvibrionaceae bacterium]